MFDVICLQLRSPCFKVDFKGKAHSFVFEWVFCYSKYLALHFQQLQFVRWTDRWSTFHEAKKNRLITTVCFRVCLIKWCMEITDWKHSKESTVHGKWSNVKTTVSVCWCPNKVTYEIAQLVWIYTLLHFWNFIS